MKPEIVPSNESNLKKISWYLFLELSIAVLDEESTILSIYCVAISTDKKKMQNGFKSKRKIESVIKFYPSDVVTKNQLFLPWSFTGALRDGIRETIWWCGTPFVIVVDKGGIEESSGQ